MMNDHGDSQRFFEGGLLFLLPPSIASAPNDFSLFQNGFGVKMFFRGICFDLYFTAFVNERNLGRTFWYHVGLDRVKLFKVTLFMGSLGYRVNHHEIQFLVF